MSVIFIYAFLKQNPGHFRNRGHCPSICFRQIGVHIHGPKSAGEPSDWVSGNHVLAKGARGGTLSFVGIPVS